MSLVVRSLPWSWCQHSRVCISDACEASCEATIKSSPIQTLYEENPKKKNTLRISQSLDRAVCDNLSVNGAYQPLIIGPSLNANEFWPEHEIKSFDTQKCNQSKK